MKVLYLLLMFFLFSSLVWAQNPNRGAATPLSVNPPSPTLTPMVIAENDPPAAAPAAQPAAEHVGPALRITHFPPEERLVLKEGSRLWIKGSTTKRSFELWANELFGSAILKSPLDPSNGETALLDAVKNSGVEAMTLDVPIVGLQAGDPQLEHGSDYALAGPYQTLKGKENPSVQFRLEEEKLEKGSQPGVYTLKASGKLAIGGVTRDIPLVAQAVFSGTQVRLTGTYQVRLKTFNIKPLADVWGKMSSGDSVEVHFDVLFGPEKVTQK